MVNWNPQQYLQFDRERTRPCLDLVSRIELAAPARIVDLGCGPGNSTQTLAERWPNAAITGIDNSPEMIEEATRRNPNISWICQDVTLWTRDCTESFDLVFSNAALQWVPDHTCLFPRLFERVAAGGALAVQVPGNMQATAHRVMRELAATEKWRAAFPAAGVREWFVHELADYYDLLTPLTSQIELWSTDYLHVLPSVEAIVEWYKGTGLRPFLACLSTSAEKEDFLADYLRLLRKEFLPRASGTILFPFRRLFLIARRSANAG